jgi:ribonuclease P protein component
VHSDKGETYRGKERIRKREDLKRLFEKGSRYYSKQYTLILLKNDRNCLRLAVSIKRGVGNATVRNYEKRLCREFFRKEKKDYGTGYDILVVVRDRTRDFQSSYTVLKGLFSRGFHSV